MAHIERISFRFQDVNAEDQLPDRLTEGRYSIKVSIRIQESLWHSIR